MTQNWGFILLVQDETGLPNVLYKPYITHCMWDCETRRTEKLLETSKRGNES